MNWNSGTGDWTPLVNTETKEKAIKAKTLLNRGYTVKEIAQRMNLSEGRIYEYFRS